MRCPNCGGYGFDWEDRCTNCGYSVPSQKPPAWWGRKDFQCPDKTPEHGEKVENEHHRDSTDSSEASEPELHDCPHCRERSLFWNQHTLMYECLNARCRRRVTSSEYKTNKEEQDKKTESTDRKRVQICPACRQTSLNWNKFTGIYECFNPSCKRDFSRSELEKLTVQPQPHEEHIPPKDRPSERLEKCPACGQGMLRWNPAISKYECLYWKCRRTITKEYFESVQIPKEKSRFQLPRFNTISRVSIGLLVLVVFAFTLLYGLTDFGQSGRSVIPITSPTPSPASYNTPGPIATPTPRVIVLPTRTPLPTVRPIITPRVVVVTPRPLVTAQPIITPASDSGWVWVDAHTYLVGADGEPLVLVNNPSARNPSWSQLVSFLKADRTDQICYDERSFICADFAEMLHNNAEKAGWKAAYVGIELASEIYGHALNAFQTTDRGLVYIDCTGLHCNEPRPIYMDSRVDLRVGGAYIPECIFPEPDWYCTSPSMGVVTEIDVVQW